jgi:S1-C subfamily serine protease
MKALLIRNAQKGAVATAAMARAVACALCIGSLLVLPACTGSTQKAGTTDTSVHVDHGGPVQFPSNAQLRRTTVSLRMAGFTFGSGVTLNDQGKPTGNGAEIVPHQWCGSGFVIGKDGTIVTNYHVARRALRGQAIFDGGAKYDLAHLKVYDPKNDLAVLKINATDAFATVQLGDANLAEVRDSVLAAGNGLCEGLSVTEGTMSMFRRDERTTQIALLVHTASIAPGNSGGPLYKGERVIGINVQEARGHQRYYAVPINKLQPLLDEKFNRASYLQDVFSPEPLAIAQKAHPLFGGSGQVKAASQQGPGIWSTRADLTSLGDYAILVKTSSKKNLDLIIQDEEAKLIGLGTNPSLDEEVVLLSSEFNQTVTINVVNPAPVSVNFEVSIHKIHW